MNAERMALNCGLESSNPTEEPCWYKMEFLPFAKQGYNPSQVLELTVMGSKQVCNKSSLYGFYLLTRILEEEEYQQIENLLVCVHSDDSSLIWNAGLALSL